MFACSIDAATSEVLGYRLSMVGTNTGLSPYNCLTTQTTISSVASPFSLGRGIIEITGVVGDGVSVYAYTCDSTSFTLEIKPVGLDVSGALAHGVQFQTKVLVFRVPAFTPFYTCLQDEKCDSQPESGIVVTPESLDDGDFSDDIKSHPISTFIDKAGDYGLTLSPSFIGTLTDLLANHKVK